MGVAAKLEGLRGAPDGLPCWGPKLTSVCAALACAQEHYQLHSRAAARARDAVAAAQVDAMLEAAAAHFGHGPAAAAGAGASPALSGAAAAAAPQQQQQQRARRRLRYTSRRDSALNDGAPPARRRRREGCSAEGSPAEVSEEEGMRSPGDGAGAAALSGGGAAHRAPRPSPRSHELRLPYAHARAGGGAAGSEPGLSCDEDGEDLASLGSAELEGDEGPLLDEDDEEARRFAYGDEGSAEGDELRLGPGSEDGCEGEEVDEEEGLSLAPGEEPEEDGPCVSLFVVAGDAEAGFDALITRMWGGGGDEPEPVEPGAGRGAALEAGGAAPAAGGGGRGRGAQQGRGARGGGGAPPAAAPGGEDGGGGGGEGELVGPRGDEPHLSVADWWMGHLRFEGPQPPEGLAGAPPPADDVRVLRWVYGNIVNVQVGVGEVDTVKQQGGRRGKRKFDSRCRRAGKGMGLGRLGCVA
jgi:hypothetical protein